LFIFRKYCYLPSLRTLLFLVRIVSGFALCKVLLRASGAEGPQHLIETGKVLRTVLPNTSSHFVQWTLMPGFSAVLGKEFVGKADDLFFHRNRHHFTSRQGQFKMIDVVDADPHSDVTLAYQGVTGQPLSFKQFPPEITMTDIRLVAVTSYPRRSRHKDSDIVEHGSLLNENPVRQQMSHLCGNLERSARNQSAVFDKYGKGGGARVVVFPYDLKGI
jgi:hypothetical protein